MSMEIIVLKPTRLPKKLQLLRLGTMCLFLLLRHTALLTRIAQDFNYDSYEGRCGR